MNAGSRTICGTTATAMKMLSQPLRVAATRMPTHAHPTASGSETTLGHAWWMRTRASTPMKSVGKIRPPRKPDVAATSSANSLTTANTRKPTAVVVAARPGQLLHLLEALEQGDLTADRPEDAEQQTADRQHDHRVLDLLERVWNGTNR